MNIQSFFTVYTAALHALILNPLLFAYFWLGISWIDSIDSFSANKRFSSSRTSSRKPYSNSKQQEKQKHSAETTINLSYFKQGKVQKYALQDTVWVERHHTDVLSRHPQASWYVPGVIVRKVGQDVYAVRVGDNRILDRDHTKLRPRAPDPSGRPVTFEFTAGDVDSDDEGEDDEITAEKILADKPDPGTPGGRLYKVRWKGFAASRDSWEPPSSFVPRYTTVLMDYLKKKNISLDVKDVLVHLVAAVAP